MVQSANGWVSCRRRGSYAPRTKGSPYDGGVRSPVIVSWPARIKPAVSDALVSSIDVVPTVLAAAGAKQPSKALPGTNLLPIMTGEDDLDARAIFGESFARDTGDFRNPEATLLKRWVIRGSYKLILTYDGAGSYSGGRDRPVDVPELFDLMKDPYEETNLHGELPEVAEGQAPSAVRPALTGVAGALRAELERWYPLKERRVVE